MRNILGHIRAILSALRTTWGILGVTLLLIVLLEGGFQLTFRAKDLLLGVPTLPDPRVVELGYNREAWPYDHFRELERLQYRWEPYVYSRQNAFDGKTIHTDADGRRVTWKSGRTADAGKRPVKILFLGGSALWGFGARDEFTIPSYVAKDLDRRGISVEIRNRSEIGYVNTQELMLLTRDLRDGLRPDYVVFYDGVNDTTSALLDGTAGVSTNEGNRRQEFNLLQSPARLLGRAAAYLLKNSATLRFAQSVRRRLGSGIAVSDPNPSGNEKEKLAAEVVRHYEANLEMVHHLGADYGFKPLFFWQPSVYDKPKSVPFEDEEKKKFAWTEAMFKLVYGKARASDALKKDPSFHDLSGIFADSPELLFIDFCHTTEAANEKIAKVIAETLARSIAEGSSASK